MAGAPRIPDDELQLSFSRSGGPGGQHANTSATKVELRWDVAGSTALTAAEKEVVRDRLASRLTTDGVLVLQASEHRSQTLNREAVIARLHSLLADALRPRKPRRPTKPPKSADERRLEDKRRTGQKKALRQPPDSG